METHALSENSRSQSRIELYRVRVYQLLHKSDRHDVLGLTIDGGITALIILNVIAVILGTEHYFAVNYARSLKNFEILSIVIFTVEYLLRVWCSTVEERYRHPIFGRLRYVISFMAFIDLLSILPFYLPLTMALDLRFLRALRLLRILRVLKLHRYSEALQTIEHLLKEKREELGVTIFMVFVLLVISSSLMYVVENHAQPEKFTSIPRAMWWCVAAMTSGENGGIYPVTSFGKLLGVLISFLGIGLFALPAGIIASGFIEIFHQRHGKVKVCPKCGHRIE